MKVPQRMPSSAGPGVRTQGDTVVPEGRGRTERRLFKRGTAGRTGVKAHRRPEVRRQGRKMARAVVEAPGESTDERAVTKWHESLYGIDLLMLHAAPVYYGVGVPQGDGSGVIMIPDSCTATCTWCHVRVAEALRATGPYYSGIDLKRSAPNLLIKNQLDESSTGAEESGRNVHLIGHSLGGVIARSSAIQRPAAIASLITLGRRFPAGRAWSANLA